MIEPRPSWPAGFVRRELENDPAFRVASILRTSTDVATRAGESPRAVTLDQLLPFEVVIAGAPEELRAAEVDALRRFAELRGGTVVLLPDRRPSGAYAELLPGTAAEQLLAEPRLLEPAGIPASEIVSVPAGGRCPAARVAQWRAGDLFLAARRRPVALLRRAGRVALPRRPALARSRILAGCDHDGSARGTAAQCDSRWNRRSCGPGGRRGSWREFDRPSSRAAEGDREGGSFAIEAHVTDPRGRDDIVRLHPTMEHGTLEGIHCDVAAGGLRRHRVAGERRAQSDDVRGGRRSVRAFRLRRCSRASAGADGRRRRRFVGSLAARAASLGDSATITSRGCASDAIGVVDGRIRRRALRRMDAAPAQRIEVTT